MERSLLSRVFCRHVKKKEAYYGPIDTSLAARCSDTDHHPYRSVLALGGGHDSRIKA
jgi:hypothetical protein